MRRRAVAIALALTWAAAGCATARPPRGAAATASSPGSSAASERESLERYVASVRAISQEAATERRRAPVRSVESTDPVLRDALAGLAVEPTPDRHHAVAAAYLHAGIVDLAFDHFTAALRLERSDATAYDGLARIWRDWGFPHLGLSDSHRAVFYAPQSAAAHNTLGTLLQALGQPEQARREYQAALSLDPQAAYALNNLCTLGLEQGRLADARSTCRQALSIDPTLLSARRNLATLLALEPDAGPRAVKKETGSGIDGSGKPPGE